MSPNPAFSDRLTQDSLLELSQLFLSRDCTFIFNPLRHTINNRMRTYSNKRKAIDETVHINVEGFISDEKRIKLEPMLVEEDPLQISEQFGDNSKPSKIKNVINNEQEKKCDLFWLNPKIIKIENKGKNMKSKTSNQELKSNNCMMISNSSQTPSFSKPFSFTNHYKIPLDVSELVEDEIRTKAQGLHNFEIKS